MLLSTDITLNKVLVFVGTKKLADRLYEQIINKFPNESGIIHSNKSHNNRLNALKQFQDNTHRLLIATDIIARGMDITDVSHVINFDMPDVPGDYIHRIGRTGRADKDGVAISFINVKEQTFQLEIEKLMKKKITMIPLPENLAISKIYTEEERPTNLFDKSYRKEPTLKNSQGAFHEKITKNKKVNLGGPKQKLIRLIKSGKPKFK